MDDRIDRPTFARGFADVGTGVVTRPDARRLGLVMAALSDWKRMTPIWNGKNDHIALNHGFTPWYVHASDASPEAAEEADSWSLHDGSAEFERWLRDSDDTGFLGVRLPRSEIALVRLASSSDDASAPLDGLVIVCSVPGRLLVLEPEREACWSLHEEATSRD